MGKKINKKLKIKLKTVKASKKGTKKVGKKLGKKIQKKIKLLRKPKKAAKGLRLAAIDIGSNAIRLVLGIVSPKGRLRTIKKWRAPVRLGEDVFQNGSISDSSLAKALVSFRTFAQIIEQEGVLFYRAVATSALREAANSHDFTEAVSKETNLKIEIIDGIEEGRLVYQAVRNVVDISEFNVLLIDVGGGSVEISSTRHGALTATQSFPMGTVRIIDELKKRNQNEVHLNSLIHELFQSVKSYLKSQDPVKNPYDFAVGTGGNLEALGQLKAKLLKKKNTKILSLNELRLIIQKLQLYTIQGRIEALELKKDRADVIVPAALTVEKILTEAKIEKLVIPQVGLREGIMWGIAQNIPLPIHAKN